MTHVELYRESLGNDHWFIEMELRPEDDFETTAIHHVEIGIASDEEINVVENYLHVAVASLTLVNLVRQKNRIFAVTAKR